MRRKKGSFLTFCFSLIPGAGHMYMGFMKIGLSLMSLFFLIIFTSSWLNIGPILYLLPILWFYSFFDSMNRFGAGDEVFASLEDRYLFSLDRLFSETGVFRKRHILTGALLVVFGAYVLFNNLLGRLYNLIDPYIYDVLSNIMHLAPQVLVGAAIIALGIKLILSKKKEGEGDV